jgi:hypothetical protein
LEVLNAYFRESYSLRRETVRSAANPVIVEGMGAMTLYYNGRTNRVDETPQMYEALKTVAHAPFGIYLRVVADAKGPESPLPASTKKGLAVYRKLISSVEASLADDGFSEEQLRRQRSILAKCKAFIDLGLETGVISAPGLASFARDLGPLMLENVAEAARAQIDQMRAQTLKWRSEMPAEDWARLVVVVRGRQTPRRMNIGTQFFAKLLGEPAHNLGYPLESRRLVYAESLATGDDGRTLLATTLVDGDASEAFFGERWRLSRDILADAAEEYLKTVRFD